MDRYVIERTRANKEAFLTIRESSDSIIEIK